MHGWKIGLVIGALLVLVLIWNGSPDRSVRAQEQTDKRIKQLKQKHEELESRLIKIKKALQQAKKKKDNAKVKELRGSAEEYLKEIVAIEKAIDKLLNNEEGKEKREKEKEEKEEKEEEGEGEEEGHRFLRHLEIQRLSLENRKLRVELALQESELAKNKEATAALALQALDEHLEDEGEEAVEYLEKLLKKTKNSAVRTMIRLRILRRAGEENEERAEKHLKALLGVE